MILKFLILLTLLGVDCLYYNVETYLNLVKNDSKFLNYYSPFFNESLSLLGSFSDSTEINLQCRSSLKRWIKGLNEREEWALKFLEATGKTINGKLLGRNVNFGSFDYCTMFYANQEKKIDFDGKYCMISLQTKEFEAMKQMERFKNYFDLLSERSKLLNDFSMGNGHGICVPSTCKIEELVSVINRKLKPHGFSIMAPTRCTTYSEPEPWTKLQLISLVILSTFVILCALSLVIENQFLSCFSLVDNWNIIYNLEHDNTHDTRWLHGYKAMLLFAATVVHSMILYGMYWSPPFSTVSEIEHIFTFNIVQYVEQTVAVASQLFFVGGFFSLYSWYDVIKLKAIKFNPLVYVLTRYHRIMITSLPIMLLYFLLPQVGSGPLFSQITNHLLQNCRSNGYKTIISTSNLHDQLLDMCIPAAWYLSADSLCYILSYFLIYYLAVRPKIGFRIAFLQILLSSILTIAYNAYYNINIFTKVEDLEIYDQSLATLQDIYFPTVFHLNTYILGMLCAYLIRKKIRPKIIENDIFRTSICCLTPIMHCTISLALPYYFQEAITGNGSFLKHFLKTIYPIINKASLALCLFWWTYIFSMGYPVLVKRILSLKIWIPFSRLAFPFTLSQFIFLAYSFAIRKEVYTISLQVYCFETLNTIAITFVLSNFIFLFVEGPIIKVFKMYTGIKGRSEVLRDVDMNNNSGICKKLE